MSISATIPTYRNLCPAGFWISGPGILIEENEAFEWEGPPNSQMEALNEPARKKLEALYKQLEASDREVAEKNGRAYTGRSDSLDVKIAQATADARRIELRPGDGGVPVLGNKQADSPHYKKVALETAPSVRRVGRPSKESAA